jgi:Ca2+/Na+ antiporter|tara:strand:+ start:13 stop:480 length:468 start_codon:yes stop_codon:yes gene_type:complete
MTFIRSFLIAGVVAVLFGFALRNVFGFWEATALAFVLQFVVAFVYSSFKISKNTNLTQEFENELNQLLSLSEASVACPCGNYIYTDNIFLNLDNGFTCEKCNNEFRIDISLTPTLLTTPVNVGHQFQEISEEPPEAEENKDEVSITQEYTKGTEL